MVKADVRRDYYADLGLTPSAESEEIKRSFRKLALKYHPDRNPGHEVEFNSKFQAIQAANEILSDPHQRLKYDTDRLRAGYGRSYAPKPAPRAPRPPQPPVPPKQAGSKFAPPPPRPSSYAQWTGAKPAPSGPSAGSQRYSTHARAGPQSWQKPADDAQTRADAFKGFSGMRGNTGSAGWRGFDPQTGRSSAGSTTGGAPRAQAPFGTPKGKTAYETFKEMHSASPNSGKKKSGYAPGNAAGDEPPARNTSAYTHNRSERPSSMYFESAPPPTARKPPPAPEPPQFPEGIERNRRGYAATGGERTTFSSTPLGRSASARTPSNSAGYRQPNSRTTPPSPEYPHADGGHHSESPRPRRSKEPRRKANYKADDWTSSSDPDESEEELDAGTPRAPNKNKPKAVPKSRLRSKQNFSDFHSTGSPGVNPTPGKVPHTPKKPRIKPSRPLKWTFKLPPKPASPKIFPWKNLRPYPDDFRYSSSHPSSSHPSSSHPSSSHPSSSHPSSHPSSSHTTSSHPSSHPSSSHPSSSHPSSSQPFSSHPSSSRNQADTPNRQGHHSDSAAFNRDSDHPQHFAQSQDPDWQYVRRYLAPMYIPPALAHQPTCRKDSNQDTTEMNQSGFGEAGLHKKFSAEDWRAHLEDFDFLGASAKRMYSARASNSPGSKPRSRNSLHTSSTDSVPTSKSPGVNLFGAGPGDQSQPQTTEPPQQPTSPFPFAQAKFSADEWSKQLNDLKWNAPEPDTSRQSSNNTPPSRSSPRKQSRAGTKVRSVPKPASVASEGDEASKTVKSDEPPMPTQSVPAEAEAMDIDDELPDTPDEPGNETATATATATKNGEYPDLFSNVPPETRAPENAPLQPQQPQSPEKPRHAENGAPKQEMRTPLFNLDNLRNTAPFTSTNSGGIENLADVHATLPFESRAKQATTTERDIRPRELQLPNPPKRPSAPKLVSMGPNTQVLPIDKWRHYLSAMSAYIHEWKIFNRRMLAHFNARQEAIETGLSPNWMSAVGDTTRLKINGEDDHDHDNNGPEEADMDEYLIPGSKKGGFSAYVRGIEEDIQVRKHWDVACELHRECILELGRLREWIRNGGKLVHFSTV